MRATPTQRHPRFATDAPVDILATDVSLFETRSLVNISLGGAFISSARPHPPGSDLRLRLQLGDEVLRTSARVVHVLDRDDAQRKGHPSGMGISFHSMEPSAKRRLWVAVTRLANATLQATVASSLDPFLRSSTKRVADRAASSAQARAASTPIGRFHADAHVVVSVADAHELAALWRAGLEHGRLLATTPDPPTVGTRVTVELRLERERWSFLAEVSHVMTAESAAAWRREPGAGLRLLDFDGSRRRVVEDRLPRS